MTDVTTVQHEGGAADSVSTEPGGDDDGLAARTLALAGLGVLLAVAVASVLGVAWKSFNPIRGC